MKIITGYDVKKQLYSGLNSDIYRAIRKSDNLPVIIKILNKQFPSLELLNQFEKEYSILKNSDIPGSVEIYDIIDVDNSKAIIMKDDGSISLHDYLNKNPVTIEESIVLAIKIVKILNRIHKSDIIHKDINPSNIIINPKTKDIHIIDFGISSTTKREYQTSVSANTLQGTLVYISPEQTGRMNRSIDYRSDFYSLGITFYEIFTGQYPYNSDDPIELVHAHMAKKAIAPHEINSNIPIVISKIIMKLIEKQAENRYQSASGLLHDLNLCLSNLREKNKIDDFKIALNDHTEDLQIPEKIYGRDKEISYLLNTFEQVTTVGNKEIIFISGESGIGKTVLVKEIHKPVVKNRGFFISGKYDQFKRDIPYSGIIQAFQDLIKQILTEGDEKIREWKAALQKALGVNGQLITKVIPEVELLIGKQPDVAELGPVESQNRFNMVFQNFIKVFSTKTNPLVIFLDDLQWADSASLSLLAILLNDIDLQYLLFIGSYRDNEVDNTHPLIITQERLKKQQIKYYEMKIDLMQKNDISLLLSDILHLNPEALSDLSDLIVTKTGGNPFFVIEFLKTIHEANLLNYKDGWYWDLEKITK